MRYTCLLPSRDRYFRYSFSVFAIYISQFSDRNPLTTENGKKLDNGDIAIKGQYMLEYRGVTSQKTLG